MKLYETPPTRKSFRTIDTRTPLRHTMPAQHGADLDLNSKAYQDFVSLLKSKDILVDLMLAICENMNVAQKENQVPPMTRSYLGYR